ncbi:MAG: Asp-tRNA(Asn)/Glu-tRNA(Gln) amidotransferase subunit GatB [Burkholderiales bacterium]
MRSEEWEIVIGLEVHAQLKTKSKIFSGAATDFGAAPNVNASAVDIALPGVLPVANRAAVEAAIKFGLAVNGEISPVSIFARKNYFYPDLPKGYQISQYEQPVVVGGAIDIESKSVRLTRAHLEEDAGKSVHAANASGIDLNRAGTPLLEIVSEPDIRSADEAVEYARALHALVRWIDVCDGNLQEGSFRVDANVSVRKAGDARLGTRCEIKNLNSFRFLKQAIEFEAARQIDVLESGGRVILETRLYDPEKNETRAMRTKEEAHDYRYFPDPDLLPLAISAEWIEAVREKLPELPKAKRARYVAELKLSDYDAQVLTSSRESAAYYEAVLQSFSADPKLAANWVTGELAALLNRSELGFDRSPIASAHLAGVLARIADGTLSSKTAKQVFDSLAEGKVDVDAIIAERGLKQLSDTSELEMLVIEVIANSPKQVADYRAGKEKLLTFFVGQVMKKTAGRANPAQLNEIVRRKLEESKI